MLKRTEIVAVAKRVRRRLAANEVGVAPIKQRHIQRLATLKQQQNGDKRKGRKAAATS